MKVPNESLMDLLAHQTFAPTPNRCRAQPPNTENRMFGGVGGAGNQPCLDPIYLG